MTAHRPPAPISGSAASGGECQRGGFGLALLTVEDPPPLPYLRRTAFVSIWMTESGIGFSANCFFKTATLRSISARSAGEMATHHSGTVSVVVVRRQEGASRLARAKAPVSWVTLVRTIGTANLGRSIRFRLGARTAGSAQCVLQILGRLHCHEAVTVLLEPDIGRVFYFCNRLIPVHGLPFFRPLTVACGTQRVRSRFVWPRRLPTLTTIFTQVEVLQSTPSTYPVNDKHRNGHT